MTNPIVFVRHGQTDWNRAGRLQGKQNIPLNDLGRRQAGRNGRVLGPLLSEHDWRVLISPLGRTRETAAILLAEAGYEHLEQRIDDRVIELSFGTWEGQTLSEIRERDPEAGRERRNNKWHFTPPGGESYAILAERAQDWFYEIDSPTLIVSHGGVFRALAHLVGGMPKDEAASFTVWQDRVYLFKDREIFAI